MDVGNVRCCLTEIALGKVRTVLNFMCESTSSSLQPSLTLYCGHCGEIDRNSQRSLSFPGFPLSFRRFFLSFFFLLAYDKETPPTKKCLIVLRLLSFLLLLLFFYFFYFFGFSFFSFVQRDKVYFFASEIGYFYFHFLNGSHTCASQHRKGLIEKRLNLYF